MVRYPLTLMDAWHTMHSVGYPWNLGGLAGSVGAMPAISCATLNIRLLSLDFQASLPCPWAYTSCTLGGALLLCRGR